MLEESDEELNIAVNPASISSPNINYQNLVFAREIYAQATIPGYEVVNAEIRTCLPTQENITGYSGDFRQSRVIDTDGDTIYFRGTLREGGNQNRYSEFNNLQYDCEVSARLVRSGVIYGTQTFNVPVHINLVGERTLEQYIDEEIENVRERTQNIGRAMQYTQDTLDGVGQLCGIYQIGSSAMGAVGAGVAAVEAAAAAAQVIPGVGQGLGAKAVSVGQKYRGASQSWQASAEIPSYVCEALSCKSDFLIGEGALAPFTENSLQKQERKL